MAQTHKLPVSVVLGTKDKPVTYAPGADIPVGDKGISKEEIERVEAVHGKFEGSALAARVMRDQGASATERALARAGDDMAEMKAKLQAAEKAAADNEARAVAAEKKAAEEEARNAELVAKNAEMEAEIGKLKKPENPDLLKPGQGAQS